MVSGNRDNVTQDMSLRALFWHLEFQRGSFTTGAAQLRPAPRHPPLISGTNVWTVTTRYILEYITRDTATCPEIHVIPL